MNLDLSALHFIRPHWLWALPALLPLAWWWWRRRQRANVWRDAVDPHLLPQLLDGRAVSRGQLPMLIGALGYLLAVLALAGPSWRQLEQPLWQSRTPLVIALDLSSASLAGDVPPSRLAQARAKLQTLLAERDGGQVGLVAYAGDAFTVAPLTADAANVALFLDALHPSVMPIDGQRADRAIAHAANLLQQAGFDRGHILLMTGQVDADAREAAASVKAQGYRVSALGLGTAQGAPYQQAGGAIANAALDAQSLRQLVQAGGGDYASLTRDDADLKSLGVLDPGDSGSSASEGTAGRAWHDEGYWLLLPLMLLALLAFRRGAAVMLVVAVLWLPGRQAMATELWRRPDQVAHQQMQQAADAYRDGDFKRAAQLYAAVEGADADYNRGNALAKAGAYAEAVKAYDQALRQDPGMEDAIANKRAVEAAMKRKPPPGKQQDKPKPGDSDPKESSQGGDPGSASEDPPKGDGAPKPSPSQDGNQSQQDTPPPQNQPADAEAQQSANEAQRQRMEQALANATEEGEDRPSEAELEETPEQRERRLVNEAWLRRIPDDPGGLLREKFRLEHERRRMQDRWEE